MDNAQLTYDAILESIKSIVNECYEISENKSPNLKLIRDSEYKNYKNNKNKNKYKSIFELKMAMFKEAFKYDCELQEIFLLKLNELFSNSDFKFESLSDEAQEKCKSSKWNKNSDNYKFTPYSISGHMINTFIQKKAYEDPNQIYRNINEVILNTYSYCVISDFTTFFILVYQYKIDPINIKIVVDSIFEKWLYEFFGAKSENIDLVVDWNGKMKDLEYKGPIIEVKDENGNKNLIPAKFVNESKKFDIVFGNPPYDRSLHLKIAENALKTSNNVIFIHPARWFEDPIASYKDRSTKKQFKNLVKHLENALFLDVKTCCKLFNIAINADLMISIFNKDENNKIDNPNTRIANSCLEKIIKFAISNSFEKNVDKNKKDGWRCQVKEMIPTICGAKGDFCVSVVPKNTEAVFYNGLNKDGIDWTETRKKCGQSQNSGSPFPWSIKFNSEKEAINFKNSCICTFFINWIYLIKTDMHVPFFAIPFMNDYSKEWTNKDYCKFFNLTDEESKFMCRTVNDYKEKDFIKYGSFFK